MAIDEIALSKNQVSSRANELDVEGEARLYRAFRFFWHPVLYAHELTDAPVRTTLCGEQVVLVRLEGEVCAFNDLCAHRGTALSLGAVVGEGSALRCAYHGWQYNKEGLCILAPQRPDLSKHLHARVRKYNAAEAFGMIWVCLEDTPHFSLPELPHFDDESFTKAYLTPEDWHCSAPRRTENYCDLSHLAWVHDGYLGDSNHPEVPPHEVWREGRCVRMEIPFVEPAGTGKYESLGITEEVTGVYRYYIYMPLTVRLDMDLDAGYTYTLFFHPTPVGPKTTRNFTLGTANYGGDPEALRAEIRDFQRLVYDQDKPVVESQRPEELPEDLSYELHLKGADTFHLVYRSFLIELARTIVPDDPAGVLS
jgi:vanillate O-demethylase monooxygenase subunit